MSLTTGRGPLSKNPAGHFDPPVPADTVYVEPFLRRVRGLVGDRTVLDSERVVLVHRAGQPPAYAFPEADVAGVEASPEPAAAGYVRVAWEAVTAWYEEEEQVFGHPRNPYHRVDCVRTRRRLRVEVAGAVLVDTSDTIGVYETSRASQLYVPREAVRMELLIKSPTTSYCPYKGTASYWSAVIPRSALRGDRQGDTVVADVAWSYEKPHSESSPIAGLLAFYPERTTLHQDVPTWFSPPTAGRSHA